MSIWCAGREAAAPTKNWGLIASSESALIQTAPSESEKIGPGITKRYCLQLSLSKMEKSSRVSFAIDRMAGDFFTFDQPTQRHSGRAAARTDRERLATEPPYDAGYVHPTSARVAPRSRASQLARRYDPLNRRRHADRRPRGKGDDAGHGVDERVTIA